jgi:hypothetical protein
MKKTRRKRNSSRWKGMIGEIKMMIPKTGKSMSMILTLVRSRTLIL